MASAIRQLPFDSQLGSLAALLVFVQNNTLARETYDTVLSN